MTNIINLAQKEDIGRVQQDGGFDGAVLSGCALDVDKVVLNQIVVDSRVTSVGATNVFDATWQAAKFTAGVSISNVTARVKVSKTGAPPNDLAIHIYSESGGNPNVSIGSANLTAATLTTSLADYDVNINTSGMVLGTTYYIVFRTVGGDASNKYGVAFDNSLSSGGNYTVSNDSGATWGASATVSLWFYIFVLSLSGTVTQTITPDSLYKFENIFFNTITPANTTITARILDALDNVLIASVTDKGSLASIDTTLYKSIKAEWTLTRVATTDTTPELHEPFWTWTGIKEYWEDKTFETSAPTGTHEANTHLDVTGSGYLVAVGENGTTERIFGIQVDGGTIYKINCRYGWASLPLIRFNESILITGSVAKTALNNAWVVLD